MPTTTVTGSSGQHVNAEEELKIVNRNLTLLRERYLKLNKDFAQLRSQYDAVVNTNGPANQFPGDVLSGISKLFDNAKFSDITIAIGENGAQTMAGHKFLLSMRSKLFMNRQEIPDVYQFKPDVTYELAYALVQFMYQNKTNVQENDQFALKLMLLAYEHGLEELVNQCESMLIGMINTSNCAIIFKHADEIKATSLREASLGTILNEFDQLDSSIFDPLSSHLVAEIYREKSKFPLHFAIRHGREDVVFLFLLEPNISKLLSGRNEDDKTPLTIALDHQNKRIAQTLVEHGCDIHAPDSKGRTLLHNAILANDLYSAKFLIQHDANVNTKDQDGRTPFHEAVQMKMMDALEDMLQKHCDINAVTTENESALHIAVAKSDVELVQLIISQPDVDLNIMDTKGVSPFGLALAANNEEIAKLLSAKGCDLEAKDFDGNTLMHRSILQQDLFACDFLMTCGASVNSVNNQGESVLHLAASMGLEDILNALLIRGSENAQSIDVNKKDNKGCTPLHRAILSHQSHSALRLIKVPDMDVEATDNDGISPLWLALISEEESLATELLNIGANIAAEDKEGTLLHRAVVRHLVKPALFLIRHGARIEKINHAEQSCLELAILGNLTEVVRVACQNGARVNDPVSSEEYPLQMALERSFFDVATVLVQKGADVNVKIPDGKSLLQLSIENRNSEAALFLINNKADVAVMDADRSTPVHVAIQNEMVDVVDALLAKKADPNLQNKLGNTPLHIAVAIAHQEIVERLLQIEGLDVSARDAYGRTVFDIVFEKRNAALAKLLHQASNQFSTQTDDRGLTMLQRTIGKNDEEGIKFLLDLKVDVLVVGNSIDRLTPLHIAAALGQADTVLWILDSDPRTVNAQNARGRTPLHLAALGGHVGAVTHILRVNSIPITDVDGNTALHLALEQNQLKAARLIVSIQPSFAPAKNNKGQNPLHVIAQKGGDEAIVEFLLESGVPINDTDDKGNTPLLVAYLHDNFKVATCLARHFADLRIYNLDHVSVLDDIDASYVAVAASRRYLQHAILATIATEPEWLDGEFCNFCQVKFGVKTRKHHCRHCGRIGCSSCLPKSRSATIQKFGDTKPQRCCGPCYDYLTTPPLN